MRTLRWAAEKATDADPRIAELGMTALVALSRSELLQPEDEAFIELVSQSLLVTPVEEYRGSRVRPRAVAVDPPPAATDPVTASTEAADAAQTGDLASGHTRRTVVATAGSTTEGQSTSRRSTADEGAEV